MMKSCYILLLLSILIIIPFYTFNTAFSEDKKYFTPLTGMEEVPPVNTNSIGIAFFELLNNHLEFKVNVTNLENIKSAQIHLGEFGQNGEIIVSLLKSLSPVDIHNGTLVEGQVTPSELVGPLKGKTINELVQLFNNTKTYVNIHTEQYPNGEIRGQITTVNTTNW
jgi:CHRD domain